VGRERHQYLRGDGRQADAEGGEQKQAGATGTGGGQQGGGTGQQGETDQAAIFQQIPEHDEQQAKAVADLGQRDDQTGGTGSQPVAWLIGPISVWA
jgi:hypothetical protein